MAVTNYYTIGGELWGESTGGVMRNYITDALGSVVGTVLNGVAQNTYQYKPYGRVLAKTGTAADPRFLWNAKSGYSSSPIMFAEYYVRFRTYSSTSIAWTTSDSLWPKQPAYTYVSGTPENLTDPFGQSPCNSNCTISSFSVNLGKPVCKAAVVPGPPLSINVQNYLPMTVMALVTWPSGPPCCCTLTQQVQGYFKLLFRDGSVLGPYDLTGDPGSAKKFVTDTEFGSPCKITLGSNSLYLQGFDAPGWSIGKYTGGGCPTNYSWLTPNNLVWDVSGRLLQSILLIQNFNTCVQCNLPSQPPLTSIIQQCRSWTNYVEITYSAINVTPDCQT